MSKTLWQIPELWEWTEINCLGDVVSGGTPSTKEPSFWGDEVNWISPADLTGYKSKTIPRGAKSITRKGLENSSARLMPAGSVHFSSRAPIGYVAISSQPLSTNQGFKSVVPAEGVLNEFLYYYLKASKQLAEERATGTTFKEISGTAFGKLPIPLAPYNEQKRIVAKIEELFSELDKAIENLKTARQQLKIYRQAVLKHAFDGKLTANWREKNKDKLETAEALLEQIKQEREAAYHQYLEEWKFSVKTWEKDGRKGKKPPKPGKPKDLAPLTEVELKELPELPKSWRWVHLSKTSKKIQIGPFGSLLHKADYISGGTPLINPSHIRNQRIEPDWQFTVSCKKLQDLKNYIMIENDIVIGRRGEMGRCAVVSNKENGWLCGTGSLFVRLLPSAHTDFYCYVLSSRRTRSLSDIALKNPLARHLRMGYR